jgi:two-component system, cell cycle sensor histidine kinase and response regulator CckA
MITAASGRLPDSSFDSTTACAWLEKMQALALFLSPAGSIVALNPGMAKALSRPPEQLLGTLLWSHLPSELRAVHQTCVQQVMDTRQPCRLDLQYNGCWYDICFTPNLAPSGAVSGVTLVGWDITGRKQLEERLRQSQELEVVGRLAGGMAHEFNNILGAVLMNLGLIKTARLGAEARELLREIETLSQRAGSLVKQVLAFSRLSAKAPQHMDLAAVVADQCSLLKTLLGAPFLLEFSCAPGLSALAIDKALIEQIILNLCLNARDELRAGGLLRLSLDEVDLLADPSTNHPDATPGRYLRLSLFQAGPGLGLSASKQPMQPVGAFQGLPSGLGLGLAMVRGFIQQHRGWLEQDGGTGTGSTVRVYLPLATQPPSPPSAAPIKSQPRGKGTILLVEDEPAIRKPTRRLLVRNGYTVLEAADGHEAFALWERHRADINLVYSDMVMPGAFTGLQIAERALAEKPEVKAIITSGYCTELLDLSTVAESSLVYVPKPCHPSTLLSVIHECLHR